MPCSGHAPKKLQSSPGSLYHWQCCLQCLLRLLYEINRLLTLAVEQVMMKAALPILDPSPALGVQSPQASQHQAAHQQDSSSSSSRRATSPASNGCWTAGSTTTSKLPLQSICTSSCMSVCQLSAFVENSTSFQPRITIIRMSTLF